MKKFFRFIHLYIWMVKHRHGDYFYNESTSEVICFGCGENYHVKK